MAMHYRQLQVPVSIGVGGTIDFLAERLARAPLWMRRTGTEWIFRLLQEPKRLTGRYLRDSWYFGRMIAAQWFRMRFRRKTRSHSNPVRQPVRQEGGCHELRAPEWLDASAVGRNAALWEQALADDGDLLLNLGAVRFVDSTGIGCIIRLQKRAALKGRRAVLVAPSPVVRRVLESMKLWPFFLTASGPEEAKRMLEARPPGSAPERDIFAPVPTLVWRGEVTAAVAERVWESTERFLREHEGAGAETAISLREVPFIDSTGLGLMVRARKRALGQGTRLRFLSPQPDVLNVIRLARLEAYLLDESSHSR